MSADGTAALDPAFHTLAELFRGTLAPQKEVRQQSENALKQAALQHGFAITLLQLLTIPQLDLALRQAAAVSFKNTTKYCWVVSETAAYSGARQLGDDEKAQIKTLITGLMLNTPPLVRAQLSEALTIISNHDFPDRWATLLPELVERLNTTDVGTINGVLATANSIFKRYRNQYASDALVSELAKSQGVFLTPLLQTMQALHAMVEQQAADTATIKLVLASIRLAFRIFYSLNALGVTPMVEEQLPAWMELLNKYLKYDNPALEETEADKEGVLDAVKSAVCQVINIFVSKEEEDFERYLPTFMADVWAVLIKVSARPGQDALVFNAIHFLTSVARGVHARLFGEGDSLKQICDAVVLPNLRLRDEDEEMFDMNWLEYVRRDSEGSDSDTRRRAAADLLKALVERFEPQVTALCTDYVSSMLAEYAASPSSAWKAKDCAVYLVTAVTVRGKTAEHGATRTNPLVNVVDFFAAHVLPELQSPQVSSVPMLKADMLKFLTTFRSHLPKEMCVAIFPALVRLLGAPSNVVHSYAAITVERLLALKVNGQPKLTQADLAVHLEPLLNALFGAFKLEDSGENEYVMRAVMRVIGFVGPSIAPVAPICLQALAGMLMEVCRNPKYPSFNHYLFESVAALIRHGSKASSTMLATFEEMLFPPFQMVLQMDVQEFHPYVFQIFSQLIELRAAPLPPAYLQLFQPLLNPLFWERSGNVPGLVRLFQAFFQKAPDTVASGKNLEGVLGVFQKLISSKVHDVEGFHLLNTIVESLPLPAYQHYLTTIWQLLFNRLMYSRTTQYVRAFLSFLSLAVCKLGPLVAMESVDTLRQSKAEPSIFTMLLQQVWIPNMVYLEQPEALKVVTVATTKVLCECPPLLQDMATWNGLKEALERQLSGVSPPQAGGGDDDEETVPEAGEAGYTAAFAPLANAARPEHDPLADIADPRSFFEHSMAQFRATHAA